MPQTVRRPTEGDTEAAQSSGTSPEPQAAESQADDGSEQEAPFYCPACGIRYEYRQKCTGRIESPHQPVEVVSTDELKHEYNPDAKPGEPGYYTHTEV